MKLEALDGLEWTDPRLGQKLLPSLAKKNPAIGPGMKAFLLSHAKAPLREEKRGHPRGDAMIIAEDF